MTPHRPRPGDLVLITARDHAMVPWATERPAPVDFAGFFAGQDRDYIRLVPVRPEQTYDSAITTTWVLRREVLRLQVVRRR